MTTCRPLARPMELCRWGKRLGGYCRRTEAPVRDAGNVAVEFVILALVVMVPMAYVSITVSQLVHAVHQTASVAREAAAAFSAAQDADPWHAARTTSRAVSEAYGAEPAHLSIRCEGSETCPSPGSIVSVQVTRDVRLPGLPATGGEGVGTVRVAAEYGIVVDRFRAADSTSGPR